jgi:hypothetical protein
MASGIDTDDSIVIKSSITLPSTIHMLATYINAEILLYKNRLKGRKLMVKVSLSITVENVQEGDKRIQYMQGIIKR